MGDGPGGVLPGGGNLENEDSRRWCRTLGREGSCLHIPLGAAHSHSHYRHSHANTLMFTLKIYIFLLKFTLMRICSSLFILIPHAYTHPHMSFRMPSHLHTHFYSHTLPCSHEHILSSHSGAITFTLACALASIHSHTCTLTRSTQGLRPNNSPQLPQHPQEPAWGPRGSVWTLYCHSALSLQAWPEDAAQQRLCRSRQAQARLMFQVVGGRLGAALPGRPRVLGVSAGVWQV